MDSFWLIPLIVLAVLALWAVSDGVNEDEPPTLDTRGRDE